MSVAEISANPQAASLLSEALNPESYRLTLHAIPKLAEAVFNLLLGLFVFWKNPRSWKNRVYFIFTTHLFLWLFFFGLAWCVVSPRLHNLFTTTIAHFGIVLIAPGFYCLVAVMTGRFEERKREIIMAYAAGLTFYALYLLLPGAFIAPTVYIYEWGPYMKVNWPYAWFYPFFYFITIQSVRLCIEHYRTADSVSANRMRYMILGYVIANLGAIDWLPAWGINVYPIGYLAIFAFDVIMAYAIVSEKLFDIETVFLNGVVWGITSLIVLFPIGISVYWWTPWVNSLSRNASFAVGGLSFLLLAGYAMFVQSRVDSFFQKKKRELERELIRIASELARYKELTTLTEFITGETGRLVRASAVHLFLCDDTTQYFYPSSKASLLLRPTSPEEPAPFLRELAGRAAIMRADEFGSELPPELGGKVLFVPLMIEEKMIGFLALGRGAGGTTYGRAELDFLDHLRGPAATAISNSIQVQNTMESEKLIHSAQVKTAFVAMVSHEFKNPLGSIKGFVELIQSEHPIQEKTKRYLSIVRSEAERLNRLVEDLLDLSKLEREGFQCEKSRFDLKELIQEIIIEFQVLYPGLVFEHTIHQDELMIRADKDKLRQAIMNLASNAAKYSPDGGAILVEVKHRDGWLSITVEDEGPGIPAELQDKIFEKFASISAPNYRRKPGAGLGLAITKALVELQGGRVSVESPVCDGAGTRFRIELPSEVRAALPERRRHERVARNLLLAVIHNAEQAPTPISTQDVSDGGFCLETHQVWGLDHPIYFRVLGPVSNGVSGIARLQWTRALPHGRFLYGAEIVSMSEADRAGWTAGRPKGEPEFPPPAAHSESPGPGLAAELKPGLWP